MRIAAAYSSFAKALVSCFYDSEVLNPSFVHLMKFSAEKNRLRKAAKRYSPLRKTDEQDIIDRIFRIKIKQYENIS